MMVFCATSFFFTLSLLSTPTSAWIAVPLKSQLVHAKTSQSKNSFNRVLKKNASSNNEGDTTVDLEYLKSELTAYLKKRKEVNADELAEKEVGKVIGGTKGNALLDFLSITPAKESVIEKAPAVFDYSELIKYGYGKLATPIMNAGGSIAMYELMGMIPPKIEIEKPKYSPPLEIDKTGESDKARYSGLKMGQVLDDNEMAEALQRAQQKAKEGKELRSKLLEEQFELPFSDKRNVGPKQTPDWTPERLDEYGKARGRAEAWVKRAAKGEFMTDPLETIYTPLSLRLYCVLTVLSSSIAFGRASPNFFDEPTQGIIETLQIPALALTLASVGSSIVCAVVLAPEKRRNSFMWAFKGFLGGPLAIKQLREADTLITFGEQEDNNNIQKSGS